MTVHRKIGLQAMAGSGHLSPVCRRLGHGQCNTVLWRARLPPGTEQRCQKQNWWPTADGDHL